MALPAKPGFLKDFKGDVDQSQPVDECRQYFEAMIAVDVFIIGGAG